MPTERPQRHATCIWSALRPDCPKLPRGSIVPNANPAEPSSVAKTAPQEAGDDRLRFVALFAYTVPESRWGRDLMRSTQIIDRMSGIARPIAGSGGSELRARKSGFRKQIQGESGCPDLRAKIFLFRFFRRCEMTSASRLQEGRLANVTIREAGCDGRGWCRMTSDANGRPSRVVLAPQCRCQARGTCFHARR